MRRSLIVVSSVVLLLVALFPPANTGEVPRREALRVIVGEASDQGLHGMVCVGEVLRRRGSIRGFVGYWAQHIQSEPGSIWRQAALAWDMSETTHFTRGADHFIDKRRLPGPPWSGHFVKTYEYKDHVFYREEPRTTD